MKRRGFFGATAAALAAVDVPASVSSVDSTPEPLLLTITTDRTLSMEQFKNIQKVMRPIQEQLSARLGYQLPVVILDSGLTIEAVASPAATTHGKHGILLKD